MTGEDQPHQQEHQHPDGSGHPERRLDPKIYVASLSDYNNGRLHGDWIDADQPPDDIQLGIDQMLEGARFQPAEDWAIHDHEDFGAFEVGEYEQLDAVSLIAGGIVRHGRAFSHWANIVGTLDTNALERFDEHYRGQWNSMADYAHDLLDDLGTTPETFTPGWLQPYVTVDYQALGRDLSADLHTADEPDGSVHVFEAEV